MNKEVLLKRLFLLTKLIYKPLVFLAGYLIFCAAIADDHRIYADIHSDKLYAPFVYLLKLMPFKDVFQAYKDSMVTLEHSGVANAVTLFMAIPFIPIIVGGFFRGLGGLFSACAPYFFIDYVYRDTGAYADTEFGMGFWMFIISIAIRLFFCYLLYQASPFILVISWVWNLIQFLFFWPGRARNA